MAESKIYVDGGDSVNQYAGDTSIQAAAAVASPPSGTNIVESTISEGFWHIHVVRAAAGTGTPVNFNAAQLRVGPDFYDLVQIPVLGLLYEYDFYTKVTGDTDIAVYQNLDASADITISASLTSTKIA